jgi:tetratricopeptide (TPR) repeat protein
LTDAPHEALVLVREAQQLQRLGRVPEAIAAYKRILAHWPDLADSWFNLGVLQRQQRQLEEALASYQKALDYGISSPEEVHLNRGVIYSDYLRQEAAAERELQQALALNPAYVPALLNLANLNEDLGRRSEASALYERILALDPRCFEALARYANLQPASGPTDQLIEQLESALGAPTVAIAATPATAAAERASLGFALGRLLDGKGQYPAAFEAYSAANRANRASAPPGAQIYDRKRHEELIDLLIRSSPPTPQNPPATFGAGSTVPDSSPAAGAGPQPIFICGLFRSGSTLTEQLLAGHPGLVAGGELDLLPRLASAITPFPQALASVPPDLLSSLAARYRDELQRIFPGATHVTDKRLDNFLLLGFIKKLFPTARIIHTTRDPLDNCLSIFFLHLDPGVGYAHEPMDIGHYFREYRRLMLHWQRCFGPDLFEFNYDSFVRQPAACAARLFEFLGLQWDDRYLSAQIRSRAVKTASVWQVRESVYTRSSGRAANYPAQLAGLREYLSDLLPK